MSRAVKDDSSVLLEDLLGAILLEAQRLTEESKGLRFVGHDHVLQGVFYSLLERHSWLDPYLLYSKSGFAPYSQALNEAIADLQLGGMLGRENPEYEVAFLKPAADRYYEERLKHRVCEVISHEEIRSAASDLLNIFKEDNLLKDQ